MVFFRKIKYFYSYPHTTYRYKKKLDIILFYLNEIGVKNVAESQYDIVITFNDGTVLSSWNANRWYAWFKDGEIDFSNGKKMTWENSRPNYETLYRLRQLVDGDDDGDFTKYLPKSYLIKMERLKKLEQIEKKSKKKFI